MLYTKYPIFWILHNGKYNLFENQLFEFDFRESKKGQKNVLFSFLGKINYIKSTKWLMLCLHLTTLLKTQKKCCITFREKNIFWKKNINAFLYKKTTLNGNEKRVKSVKKASKITL